jgi:hypothetical protein
VYFYVHTTCFGLIGHLQVYKLGLYCKSLKGNCYCTGFLFSWSCSAIHVFTFIVCFGWIFSSSDMCQSYMCWCCQDGRPPSRVNQIQQQEHIHDCLKPVQEKFDHQIPYKPNMCMAAQYQPRRRDPSAVAVALWRPAVPNKFVKFSLQSCREIIVTFWNTIIPLQCNFH